MKNLPSMKCRERLGINLRFYLTALTTFSWQIYRLKLGLSLNQQMIYLADEICWGGGGGGNCALLVESMFRRMVISIILLELMPV